MKSVFTFGLVAGLTLVSACGAKSQNRSSELRSKNEKQSKLEKGASIEKSGNEEFVKQWECKDISESFDNNYTLELLKNSETESYKAQVVHIGFAGLKLTTQLPLCTVAPRPEAVSDAQTEITCHDGAWKDSFQAEFQLGGFIPTIGSAKFVGGKPESENLIANFSCKAVK
jgi:hypothetical protein